MRARSQSDRTHDRTEAETLPLRPFRAVRYDPARVGDLAAVLGPPDDVTTAEQAAQLAAGHPYHCLHLEVPDPNGRTFTRAAQLYRAWRAAGVLRREEAPACYVYAHRFSLDGRAQQRLGVFLAAALAPEGGAQLLPHEGTAPELVARRLRQLEVVRAHAGAVYAVWAGDGRLRRLLETVVTSVRPAWSVSTGDDEHRLWVVRGSPAWEVAALVAQQPLVIADGHHRFAAAQQLAERSGVQGTREDPRAWVPVHVVDAVDPALVVRSIHRIVTWLPRDWETVRAHLAQHTAVRVSRVPSPDRLAQLTRDLARADRPRVLVLEREELLTVDLPGTDGAEPDAVLVDRLLLQHVCGLDAATIARTVEYTPDAGEAARAVESGRAVLAVLLRPTALSTVLDWARAGRLLPPKTTYFFPKLPQGLVFYDLDDPATLD